LFPKVLSLTTNSAGAVTIYKCTTLPGLLHISDFTYAVDDVVLWTKYVPDHTTFTTTTN